MGKEWLSVILEGRGEGGFSVGELIYGYGYNGRCL